MIQDHTVSKKKSWNFESRFLNAGQEGKKRMVKGENELLLEFTFDDNDYVSPEPVQRALMIKK